MYITNTHVQQHPSNDPFNLLLNYFFLCRNIKIESYELNGLQKTIETHIGRQAICRTGNSCLGNKNKTHVFLIKIFLTIDFIYYYAVVLPQYKDCFGYKWLNESNRNKEYSQREYISDHNHPTGWYRFGGGAGIKMPTSCVPAPRCGTSATGWMNGTHPTVAQGKVTRKVCYNWENNCCLRSNNIEVVNCGQYYVYELSPPPGTGHLRYCGSDN